MQKPNPCRPCPFCGSVNIDPEGWASLYDSGPACEDCGSSAQSVEDWNKRVSDSTVEIIEPAVSD